MAKDVRFIIKGDPQGAIDALKEMQAKGESTARLVGAAFRQLGVESETSWAKQKQAAQTAFDLIKASGTASAADVHRAHEALEAKLASIGKTGQNTGERLKEAGGHVHNMGEKMSHAHKGGTLLESKLMDITMRVMLLKMAGEMFVMPLVNAFMKGVEAVDEFDQSVTKTAAMITSLQGGKDIAGNYQLAKQYAAGLNEVLEQVDTRTTLNLQNLQAITEEMVKQGVVLDYTNKDQVEGFTRLANAVAVYSRNGSDERQLRQEVSALLRGQVDQSSQLSSMLQRTVDGPLKQQVDKWRQSGTLVEELGKRLSGFGPAADDLATSWSTVKSSLETSIQLILRAGFAGIVKDVAGELGKVNEYLRDHREEIGTKIKGAWETTKALMSGVATVAKAIYNNFEPFAALIIGGGIIKGVTGMISLFTSLRDIVFSIRAGMISMAAITAGAGAAGGAAAGGGVMAAIGGGLAGTAMAIGGGVGLGYALQPAVRWVDKKLYQNFGINLTGEAMYNEAEQRNQEADQRWRFFQSQNANSPKNRAAGAKGTIPQLNLGETPEQIKEKIDLQTKELAAYKANQDGMTSTAKEQAGIRLSIIKANYDAGLVSTREYYESEKKAALDAAQQRFQGAAEYLAKEQALLAYIESKKGTSSPEYAEELARNKKALGEMQSAQLSYGQTYLDYENRMTEALRKREEEYGKLVAATLDAAGEYVKAEEHKQATDRKSIDMLRLKKEAEEGVKGAVDALAAVEKKRSVDLQTAQNKQNEELRGYAEEIAKVRNELARLNGADETLIKTEAEMRTGRDKLAQLQDKITLAWKQGNTAAISSLSQQIQLQEQLNSRMQDSISLQEQVAVLAGKIQGFNNGQAIYANSGGAFNNGVAVNPYVSPSSRLPGATNNVSYVGSNSPFVNLNSPWMSGLDSFDVGTPYVPRDMIAKIHKGERIVPAEQNARGDYAGTVVQLSGPLQVVLPNVTDKTSAADLARQLLPELEKLSRRRAA